MKIKNVERPLVMLQTMLNMEEFILDEVSSLRLPSGHSGLVLTPSNAARSSLPSPDLLVADASVCAASSLGVALGT